jgi:hypothetical protein
MLYSPSPDPLPNRPIPGPTRREAPASFDVDADAAGALLERARLLQKRFPEATQIAATFKDLSRVPAFMELEPAKQVGFFDLWLASGKSTRKLMIAELRKVSDGQPSKLFEEDADGRSVLSIAHRLATSRLPAAFAQHGILHKDLLTGVLRESLCPGVVRQGLHKTCTVTSIQFFLCRRNPIDYAAIATDLILQGEARLPGGDIVTLNPGSIARDKHYPARTDSERIFQATLMDFANGSEVGYDNQSDQHLLPVGCAPGSPRNIHGLVPTQVLKVMNAMFGAP